MTDSSGSNKVRRLSPDMIAALSAVFIGVCALGISVYQVAIMQEQNQMLRDEQWASVWPNVAVEYSYAGEALETRIVNTGIGPAKIGTVRMTFDGDPIRTWTDLIRRVHPMQSVDYVYSRIGNRVLPAEDFETVFSVIDPGVADSVRSNIQRMNVEICYCSVYGECWNYVQSFDGEETRDPVKQCEATNADFRQ